MARLPLNRAGALADGETVTLKAEAPLGDWDGVSDRGEAGQWSFTLTAEPMEGHTDTLATPAALGERQVEALSVTVSPLGTGAAGPGDGARGIPGGAGPVGAAWDWFVVRDEDGRYYPYDVLTSEATEDGAAWEESYILYGLEDPETLELLPAELEGGFVTVEPGGPALAGGRGVYTFASFTVEEGQMALRLEPDGVVGNTGYCGSIAYFLDGAGEKLFYGDGGPRRLPEQLHQLAGRQRHHHPGPWTRPHRPRRRGWPGWSCMRNTMCRKRGTGVLLPLTK